MKVAAFLTDKGVMDRMMDLILNHLKLTFVAKKPPPTHSAYQEVPMAAEASMGYSS